MPSFPVHRDDASAAFFDGTARGEFLLVLDTATGAHHEPAFDVTVDPQRYTRVPASGGATVVSWSVVHQRGPDGQPTRTTVGIVELDEGPWWWTEIAGADPDADLIGTRVRIDYERVGDGEVQPFFRAG
jgi:uncharacterized OB-fold protein